MKNIFKLSILLIILTSCSSDPSLRETRQLLKTGQYQHWAQVFLAKSHNHGRWGSCGECYFNSVGVSHKDAEDKAMNRCLNSEVAKRKPELRCIVDRAVGSRPEQIRKERAAKQKEDIKKIVNFTIDNFKLPYKVRAEDINFFLSKKSENASYAHMYM